MSDNGRPATSPEANTRPNVIPWPPVILIFLIAAAVGASTVFPAPTLSPTPRFWLIALGVAVFATGIGLDLWAILTLSRHRTTVMPTRAADRLVTSGPFRFSRNPIYLGNTTLLIGIALFLANPYFVAAAVINVVLVNKLAIEREEAHLASRFNDAWRDYAARVPRWIGPIGRA